LTGETIKSSSKSKIESLSDLIFGLALSIGAISLFLKPPGTVLALQSDIIEFGFSFLILISVWTRYTNLMDVLPIETRGTMILNLVLLFCVSLEPYLLNQIDTNLMEQVSSLLDYSSFLYAIDMAAMMFILAVLTHQLTTEERGLTPSESMRRYKRLRNYTLIWSVLFLLTALPQFWTIRFFDTPIRFFFWIIPLIASIVFGTRRLT